MKILVFSWRDPKHPLAGGAEQIMHEHMKGWISAGNNVTFFSSKIENLPREEILDGIFIIRKGHQYLGVQIAALFWYLFGRHEKFDLVVDEFHGIPFFTPFYIEVKKLAVLQEVARKVWLKNDLRWPINWIVGVIGYIFEPLIYIFYRAIPFMVGSNSAKKELVKIGIPDPNINVVPHGLILEIPKELPEKETVKTIVFLGALARDKGVEDAIKAFSLLNKMGQYNFWIIGKTGSSYYEYLSKLCQKLELKNKLKFWGFVTQKKKFILLSRSHILVNPSLLEGWGLVNLEANSIGVPVVAYNSPGLVDSVKNGVSGVICKYNSPQEIAKEVACLIQDKDRYSRLSKSAITWSKNFSWGKSRKKSLTLINRVVRVGRYEVF